MNYYNAFGGTVKSEMIFPELRPADKGDNHDTLIKIGKTPVSLPNSVKGIVFEANKTDFIIRVFGVANYWVNAQNNVIVEPLCDDDDSIRLYFLTNVMAVLACRRKYVPLHASAIVHRDGLVLFAGESGAGKSTTVAGLVNRGYQFFTDDVCLLTTENGQIRAQSSGQTIKLWADSYHVQPAEKKTPAPKTIRPGIEKFVTVTGDAPFSGQWMKINKIFFISPSADDDFGVALPLEKNIAFCGLISNVYRKRFAIAMNLEGLQFQTMLGLANTVPCASMHRPHNFSNLDEFLTRLETEIVS